jgi:hypothetical protein
MLVLVCATQVFLRPEVPVLAAGSSTTMEVCFRPLLVGTTDASLRLDSQELGQYEWKMKLTGVPTNPERSLAFNVPLGSRDTQVCSDMRRRHVGCWWPCRLRQTGAMPGWVPP